jgi:mono/diheme cytochrome c family protein
MARRAGLVVLVCAPVLAVLFLVGFEFNPGALAEPGPVETYAANAALHVLIWREAWREPPPPPPSNRQASIDEGDKLFGVECADCHGNDGHPPTDEGRWMYPRAANLISPQVQRYSDRELFVIIRNGVRMSGMPAFARVETDEHIWNIVQYLRTLPGKPAGAGSP